MARPPVSVFAVLLAAAALVGSALAHSRMTSPPARGLNDGGDNDSNPCGGFNGTGTTVTDFALDGGVVEASIGHGDTGDVFVRYWKRGDASALDAAGVPPNAQSASAWVQVAYRNVTVNPPAGQRIVTSIVTALGASARAGDIGVLQLVVQARNDADFGYQCADIRLVSAATTAAAAAGPQHLWGLVAALLAVYSARRM